jgi:hypothetical protein
MEALSRKAKSLGASEFGKSKAKNKRFFVVHGGKKMNFGSDTNNTFIDHGDEIKRKAWKARHSKIKKKDGGFAYLDKHQPEFWSWHLLW